MMKKQHNFQKFHTTGKDGRDFCSCGLNLHDLGWSIDTPKYHATLPLIVEEEYSIQHTLCAKCFVSPSQR